MKSIWRSDSIFQTKKCDMKGEISTKYSKDEKKNKRKKYLYIYNVKFIGGKNTTFYFCFTYFEKLFLLTQPNIFF